jgi:hypothetical protein
MEVKWGGSPLLVGGQGLEWIPLQVWLRPVVGAPLSLEHVPILEWRLSLLGFCSPTAVKKQSKPSKGLE